MNSPRPINIREVQRRFLITIALTLLVCVNPLRLLGLLTPFVFVALMLFYAFHLAEKNLIRLFGFVVAYFSAGLVYWSLNSDFQMINYLLYLFTIGHIFVIMYDTLPVVDARFLDRLKLLLLLVLLIEGMVGTFQGLRTFLSTGSFDGNTGDAVFGTLDLTGHYRRPNTWYSLQVATTLVFSLGLRDKGRKWLKRAAYSFALLGWVFASTMHTIYFMVFALILASVSIVAINSFRHTSQENRRNSLKQLRILLLAFMASIVLLSMVYLFMPGNVRSMFQFAQNAAEIRPDALSPKSRVIYSVLQELPRDVPWQRFVGVGPGQFNSKAALLISRELSGMGSIEAIPKHIGYLTDKYVINQIEYWQSLPWDSSTLFPYSSYLSIYGELGLFGVLIIMGISVRFFWQITDPEMGTPHLSFVATTLLFFLLMIGFQDLYWEETQGVTMTLLYLLVVRNHHKYLHTQSSLVID